MAWSSRRKWRRSSANALPNAKGQLKEKYDDPGLTLNFPDDLAQKAQHAGLLTPQAIEAMLREQLRKQAGEALRASWARGPQEELTPEIEQEIVAAVHAARAERHTLTGKECP